MTTYAEGCALALLNAIYPNETNSTQGFRYEPAPDASPVEVFGFADEPDTEVAAWRYVPDVGWSFTLRPLDIRQERDQYRVMGGDVAWYPLTGEDPTPPAAAFVALAQAAIAEHPAVPVVQP